MRRLIVEIDRDKLIKRFVYLYLFFILYDGVLRKWILVGLSTPIMMIKQVIAVLICLFGIRSMRLLPELYLFVLELLQ